VVTIAAEGKENEVKIRRVSDAFARHFKLRMCHISDTHGGFPRLHGRYDAVVHTGDFFPNSHHVNDGNKVQEAVFQMKWLEDNVGTMKQQLQGHTYLFILGNHDFVAPAMVEQFLNSEGIKAIDLTDKVVEHAGVKFYGFPYIPAIDGTNKWNYERQVPEMQIEVDKMIDVLNKERVDVLACHAPLVRCLDLSYGNMVLGSSIIANGLDYKLDEKMMPSHYLCGHIHEAHGVTLRNGMLVSNAAVTYQILEVQS
jgi:Icc-related predicted phosphoesterase